MANSTQKLRGMFVPLGFVSVSNNGTPVALTVNVDANNTNAPNTVFPPPPQFPGTQTESSPTVASLQIYGLKPGNNTVAALNNTGNVYLLSANAGNGSGNKADTGCLLAVITPGSNLAWPPPGLATGRFSPYYLYLDADTNNDGAFVVGIDVQP